MRQHSASANDVCGTRIAIERVSARGASGVPRASCFQADRAPDDILIVPENEFAHLGVVRRVARCAPRVEAALVAPSPCGLRALDAALVQVNRNLGPSAAGVLQK